MLNDDGGMQALRALGARSVPIVSRGDRYVFAQVIKDVVDFLQLDDDTTPELSPAQLAERYDHVLDTAIRLVRQMPDERLADELPDRPRSWRVLMHHVFQIPTAFLDMEENGGELTYEALTVPPPEALKSSADIARFGETVRQRFADWWASVKDQDFTGQVPTYFGGTTRHEMMERTVWHSTQHTRQVAALLEQAGVTPDRPLTPADIKGLPLTDKVWG
ncbi:MAG: DinB family protein [Gammaproteobacteria bacterium]|nr:DinB family protein [Gammaproteobacteria bacterium]